MEYLYSFANGFNFFSVILVYSVYFCGKRLIKFLLQRDFLAKIMRPLIRTSYSKFILHLIGLNFYLCFTTLISIDLWASPDFPDQTTPATTEISQPDSKSWYENIESQWGGQFKVRGSASWPDDDSIYYLIDSGPLRTSNVATEPSWTISLLVF